MNETVLTFGELIRSGVISVTDGYRAKNSELGGDGLIFLRAGHVTDAHIDFDSVERFHDALTPKLQEKTSRVCDVIITTKGNSTGRTSFVDGTMPTFVYSPHLSRWRVEDNTRIDPLFLRYWSRSPQFVNQMRGLAASTDMAPYLSLRDQQRLEINLPQIEGQRRIGEVLGSLDDKIEQNRRTGRALEGLARATFKAWFVDFEPVKAKVAGQTSFPVMPAAAFAALPDRLTDSAIGPVPDGWAVKSLAEVFDINPPRRLSKGEDTPYLDMKNMPTDGHAPDTWERRAHGSGMKFINGDTLVARITPCLENGKTAYVDFLNDGEVAWGSTEYIVLRPKPPLPEIFAYCLARTPEFRDFAIQNMTGTSGRQRVAASAMEHYHIAVPTTEIARSFGDVVQPFFQYIRASKTESSKLAALRDYLLPRLLSGRVRVGSRSTAGCEYAKIVEDPRSSR